MSDDYDPYLDYDDCAQYDDCDEYEDYGDEGMYPSPVWLYTLRNLYHRVWWFVRNRLVRCPTCKKSLYDCDCVPF